MSILRMVVWRFWDLGIIFVCFGLGVSNGGGRD